jgi:glucose/mannose-6-phosphate isomerase
MINLDDPEVYRRLDPTDMLRRIGELPTQCRQAWQGAMSFPLPPDYSTSKRVVILGMGGSAIGGDLVRSLAQEVGGAPIAVHRDYDLPAVDEGTLVIASSYSGNTEETLSAFDRALKTPAKKLAVTTGGRLKALAEENAVPVFCFHYVAEPRAAFGYSFFSILGMLKRLGLIAIESSEVEEAIETIEQLAPGLAQGVPMDANPAKKLATRLQDRVAIIYGAGVLSNVARRWKTQLNENSKTWAFHECFPELNHNAVVGYRIPSWLAERAFVIMLRSPSLHPRLLARYRLTSDILTSSGVAHELVDAQGEGPLSQILSAVLLGDYVSYYLAILNNVDPAPVDAINYLKQKLGKTGT